LLSEALVLTQFVQSNSVVSSLGNIPSFPFQCKFQLQSTVHSAQLAAKRRPRGAQALRYALGGEPLWFCKGTLLA
jgi:hypothetical protein